jgi:pimeloyl-ACP methyl ester carboxylesterase
MEALEPGLAAGKSAAGESLAALTRGREGRPESLRREGGSELQLESVGKGEPLVLIHGWAVDRRMWVHQLPVLRRGFRVITYDRRGYGQSTSAASLEQEVADLEAILAHLSIARVALVGMSQGGRIAVRFASQHPESVSALVLQGPSLDGLIPPPADDLGSLLEELARLVREGNRDGFVQRLGAHALLDPGSRFTAARAEILAMLGDYRGEDLLSPPPTSLSIDDAIAQLARITAPTLVITGSRETYWLRQVADYTARNIRGARRRVIRGGRHFVNMTHIADYNRVVLDFLVRSTTPWSERALGSA